MMTARTKPSWEPEEAEEDKPIHRRAGLAKGYQRLLTVARRAEVKMRKAAEDMEAAKACWAAFQEKLQRAYVKEKLKHKQDIEKLEEEMEQQAAAQRDAFKALQEAIMNPSSMQAGQQEAPPPDMVEEWRQLMETCEHEGDDMDIDETFAEKLNKQLQKVLHAGPKTPPRSSTARAAPRTPPCPAEGGGKPSRASLDRFMDAAITAAKQQMEKEQAERETAPDDPYLTSPSHHAGQPSPPSRPKNLTPRLGVKLKGRAPMPSPKPGTTLAAKLEQARQKGRGTGNGDALMVESEDDEEDLLTEIPKRAEENQGATVE